MQKLRRWVFILSILIFIVFNIPPIFYLYNLDTARTIIWKAYPTAPSVTPLFLAFLSIVKITSLIAILMVKKWGFWVFCLSCIVGNIFIALVTELTYTDYSVARVLMLFVTIIAFSASTIALLYFAILIGKKYELLIGLPVFRHNTQLKNAKMILHESNDIDERIKAILSLHSLRSSPALNELIQQLLCYDYEVALYAAFSIASWGFNAIANLSCEYERAILLQHRFRILFTMILVRKCDIDIDSHLNELRGTLLSEAKQKNPNIAKALVYIDDEAEHPDDRRQRAMAAWFLYCEEKPYMFKSSAAVREKAANIFFTSLRPSQANALYEAEGIDRGVHSFNWPILLWLGMGGFARAQNRLGVEYAKSISEIVHIDIDVALIWVQLAARQGDAEAQKNLLALQECGGYTNTIRLTTDGKVY